MAALVRKLTAPRVAALICFAALAVAADYPLAAQDSPVPPTAATPGDRTQRVIEDSTEIVQLAKLHMQDVCILPDPVSRTYYMIGSGRGGVRAYTSKDLVNWQGPKAIFRTPPDIWGDIRTTGIWAPEMHCYKGKYYLFLTFDSHHQLPEQWRQWRPRVTRGSQILWGDSPDGPFKPFAPHSTTPTDMMTLDGTLWVEDGVPYMVFAHEWVQITDGTIEALPLKDDLSEAAGEPTKLFRASSAKWSEPIEEGGHVTDGPYLWKGKTGKLYMIWSSRARPQRYQCGIAISDSGKLAGPWRQQDEPLFTDNGGHGMIFNTFEGKLMLVLHAPDGNHPRPRLFEIEDTGETLRIVKEFTGANPPTSGVMENPVWPRPIIVPIPAATSGVAQPVIPLSDHWFMLANPAGDFWAASTDVSNWTPASIGGGRRSPGNGGDPGPDLTAYRTSFTLSPDCEGHRVALRFDGVSNGAKIWLNGRFVREHWGSFMPFTCDVTDFVARDGQPNVLVVGVDNSRTGLAQSVRGGGLQRAVKLFALPADYLTRFHVDTDFDPAYRDATLKVWLRMDFHGGTVATEAARGRVKITLKDAQGRPVALRSDTVELCAAAPEISAAFPVARPLKWDAEHPNLYTLEASVLNADGTPTQTLLRRFGFTKTERVGRRVLVNGQEIKLRGLWGGSSVQEMVEHNINHTRQKWATEELLDECDRLGVYVTDENPVDFAKSGVANDPQFQAQYLSFMADLLERDRDHPSVIMWGLDNESDFGRNVPATFRYVRAEDPRRTAMFSWGSHAPQNEELPYDVYSFHYPPFDGDLASYGNSAFNSRSLVLDRTPPPKIPVLADEYAHLPIFNPDELRRDPNVHNFWGESLKRYWEKMCVTDGCLGGDIFGEDGSLSGRGGARPPENWLTKKAYSPVRVDNQTLINPGAGHSLGIPVENWFDHTDLSELKILWSVGAESGEQSGPPLASHLAGQLKIPARDWHDGDVVHLKFQRPRDGLVVEECALAVSPAVSALPVPQGPAPQINESADAITLTGKDFSVTFSRRTGLITRGTFHETEIIKGGPSLHVVATDRGKSMLDLPPWSLKQITVTPEDKEAVVRLSGNYGDAAVDFELRIDATGLITTKYTLGAFPFNPPAAHPRPWNDSHYGGFSEVGVSFVLTDAVDRLSWHRQSLWSAYPEDHVGRPAGVARRVPADAQGTSWGQQMGSGRGGRNSTAAPQSGAEKWPAVANDFRGMKENIYDATALVAGSDFGLQALSDAHDAVRLEVGDGTVSMIVNNEWNYPQLGNSNFMKPPIFLGTSGYANTVRVRFVH